MRRYLAVMVLGSALLAVGAPAFAAPVFIQTPAISGGLGSDAGFDVRFFGADDFVLSADTTIRSVTWRGFYAPDDTPQAVDAFTINFFADSGGTVGAVLQVFSVGNAVNRSDTGSLAAGVALYNYVADLGAGITLAAGTTYWMSIHNSTDADLNDSWYWGVTGGGNSRGSFDPVFTLSDFAVNSHTYFILDNGNGNQVPEPASLLLLASGLGAAGFRRMRNRRKQ